MVGVYPCRSAAMREHRHPHPHRDPRQPRADARPGTNPPVFAWLPVDSASGYRLEVARDPDLEEICLDEGDLQGSPVSARDRLPAGQVLLALVRGVRGDVGGLRL